jgi:hypothetical protein
VDVDAAVAAIEAARMHAQATTVKFSDWQAKVKAGVYKPPDGSTTEWGKLFANLDLAEAALQPDPPPPPPPSRTVVAVADFENGFGHWKPQDTAHGGAASVGSDSHCEILSAYQDFPGTKMLRCRVMGDSVRTGGTKGTVRAQGNLDPTFYSVHEGDEVWMEWFMRLSSDPLLNNGPFTASCILWQFGAGNGPQIILQDQNDGKGPMFEIASAFTTPPRKHFRFAPLVKDHSFKVNLHCKVSVDPTKGLLELDLDDQKVLAPTACQTLYGGGQDFNYDMYRGDNSAQNGGKGYNTTADFSLLTVYKP